MSALFGLSAGRSRAYSPTDDRGSVGLYRGRGGVLFCRRVLAFVCGKGVGLASDPPSVAASSVKLGIRCVS